MVEKIAVKSDYEREALELLKKQSFGHAKMFKTRFLMKTQAGHEPSLHSSQDHACSLAKTDLLFSSQDHACSLAEDDLQQKPH
jgi:hypothetical protein